MATFLVGQRVRIVRATKVPELIGAEAIVTRPFGPYNGDINGRHDCYIIRPVGFGEEFCAHPDDIEPIQPERNRVVSWESLNLPFDPRKVLEGVS